MREIKFRGKTESNQFIFGDLIQYENGDTAIFFKKITRYGYEATQISNRTKVDKETIGQFTGLHDKNGNEIYEGDIVQMNIERGDILCVVTWNLEVGEWDLNLVGCMIEGVRPLGLWLRDSSCVIKVIGNKFDNPELLEE